MVILVETVESFSILMVPLPFAKAPLNDVKYVFVPSAFSCSKLAPVNLAYRVISDVIAVTDFTYFVVQVASVNQPSNTYFSAANTGAV